MFHYVGCSFWTRLLAASSMFLILELLVSIAGSSGRCILIFKFFVCRYAWLGVAWVQFHRILKINLRSRPQDGSPQIISQLDSYPLKSSTSGSSDELLEVGHDQKGFPGHVTYAPLEEPWNLQIGQFQKIFYTKPNMPNENLTSYSLASGLFDELLEAGHDQKGFPGRVTYAPLEEPWNL